MRSSCLGSTQVDSLGQPRLACHEPSRIRYARSGGHPDIPEHVPAPGLAAVARAYAKIIDRVNELERADLEPTPIAP